MISSTSNFSSFFSLCFKKKKFFLEVCSVFCVELTPSLPNSLDCRVLKGLKVFVLFEVLGLSWERERTPACAFKKANCCWVQGWVVAVMVSYVGFCVCVFFLSLSFVCMFMRALVRVSVIMCVFILSRRQFLRNLKTWYHVRRYWEWKSLQLFMF